MYLLYINTFWLINVVLLPVPAEQTIIVFKFMKNLFGDLIFEPFIQSQWHLTDRNWIEYSTTRDVVVLWGLNVVATM